MKEENFIFQSKVITSQLSKLCEMRLVMESKQQILLSRSIYLSRFIKIAALEHVKDFPEIENARKLLSLTLPNFEISKSKPNWDSSNLIDRRGLNWGNIN